MPLRGHAFSVTSGSGRDLGAIKAQCGAYSAPSRDPARQDIDLGRGEPVAVFLGRHTERLVLLGDPEDQLTGIRVARDDRRFAALQRLDGRFAAVEAQPLGPFRFVLTVASETVLGQDRPDFAVEVDLSGLGRTWLRRRCRARASDRTRDHRVIPAPRAGAGLPSAFVESLLERV